jgi:lipoate-protein ligase A
MANKQTWRLVRDGITDPYMHFAVEEALLRLTDESKEIFPTLRLRQTIPSVWIGYYQVPEEDVDVDFCKANEIPIVRRLNSGGAVYQDEGSFCYSAFFKKSLLAQWKISHTDELYSYFGKVIIELCKKYNINANLSPVNDITVNGRKFYGSAQIDWYSAFAHSGSILVHANIDRMQQVLKPSDLKFIDKGFKSVKERVINLKECSALVQSIEQVMGDFINTFADILNVQFEEIPLTPEEYALAQKLYEDKYAKPEWTFTKARSYTTMVSTKIASGVLKLKLNLLNNSIQDIVLSGDFIFPNHQNIEQLMAAMKGKNIDEAIQWVSQAGVLRDLKEGIIHLLRQIKVAS